MSAVPPSSLQGNPCRSGGTVRNGSIAATSSPVGAAAFPSIGAVLSVGVDVAGSAVATVVGAVVGAPTFATAAPVVAEVLDGFDAFSGRRRVVGSDGVEIRRVPKSPLGGRGVGAADGFAAGPLLTVGGAIGVSGEVLGGTSGAVVVVVVPQPMPRH